MITNPLRDHIATAVARELVLQSQACGEYQTRDCFKVADAVIAALAADYILVPKGEHDDDKRLFKDGVWGCGEPTCKACY